MGNKGIKNKVERDNMNKISYEKDFRYWMIQILIAVAICAIGLFIVNQFYQWQYANEFLQTPCDLCSELNPRLEDCIKHNGEIIIERSIPKYTEEINISKILNLTGSR